jgi:hypothetical protein
MGRGMPQPRRRRKHRARRCSTRLLYTTQYDSTSTKVPGILATVDVDPSSPTYSQVINPTPVPNACDELHRFGRNACSSCHYESKHGGHDVGSGISAPGPRVLWRYRQSRQHSRTPDSTKPTLVIEVQAAATTLALLESPAALPAYANRPNKRGTSI